MKTSSETSQKLRNKKPKVIAIVGATAAGKTDYAIKLAQEIGGEIISADSRLVYKGFNIACAKPTKEERRGIPHYMLDIVEPTEDYSAALYAREAKKIIYELYKKGVMPIVVGGTGLYFRLLLENYKMPEVKPDYKLREELNKLSTPDLYSLMTELDKEGASSIEANDRKKLIRSIEIVKIGGMPLSKMRGINEDNEFDIEWIGCNYPRDILYDRINKRVDIMAENGMIEETKDLLNTYGRIPNITDTIGYREVIMYLDGILGLEGALNLLKQNTRRYAKRQLTWFRKNEQIKWNFYPETLKK